MNTEIAKKEAELEVGERNNNEHFYALIDELESYNNNKRTPKFKLAFYIKDFGKFVSDWF